jgi:hypothetical protein
MKFVYKIICKQQGSNPGNPELALPERFIPSSHICDYMKTSLFYLKFFEKLFGREC